MAPLVSCTRCGCALLSSKKVRLWIADRGPSSDVLQFSCFSCFFVLPGRVLPLGFALSLCFTWKKIATAHLTPTGPFCRLPFEFLCASHHRRLIDRMHSQLLFTVLTRCLHNGEGDLTVEERRKFWLRYLVDRQLIPVELLAIDHWKQV